VKALQDFSLTVSRGATLALLGPNGAGKTTFLKVVLGLVRHDSGYVTLKGLSVMSPKARRGVRYLQENVTFPSWITPLLLFRQVERVRRESTAEDFTRRCGELGCGDLLRRNFGKMSRGQRQRIALALTTCGVPDLVLLDEPSAGLDPAGRILVRKLISRLAASGTTVLLNSHLLGEVERVCRNAAFIKNGRLIDAGDLDSLSKHTGSVWVETGVPRKMADVLSRLGYDCRKDDGGVIVKSSTVPDFRKMVRDVLDTGIPFDGVRKKRESLEEIFMRIMKEDGGDVSQRN